VAGGIPLPTFQNLRHDGAMTRYNDKAKVRDHYDRVSPYYQTLWGEHLHHGYWIRGDETKETAQVQLIEHLAQTANITPGGKILDAGCGFGGSSIYLAKRYQAEATGITISPVQVEMAKQAAQKARVNAKFLLMDAEAMEFNTLFDVVWSVESIAHYQDKERFFASAAKLLKPSGMLAIIDWFKKANLKPREYEKFLRPIEKGMLVELQTMEEYETSLASNGLKIMKREILNKNCAKTWDLCLDIIKNKSLWGIAAKNGAEFVHYLKAFRAIRAGFASGKFVYGLIVAKKV
jgi:cyclopropane fatty-acyl-phospholipid synthase-like methyltransferase